MACVVSIMSQTPTTLHKLSSRQLVQLKNLYSSLIHQLTNSLPVKTRTPRKSKQSKTLQLEKQTKFLIFNEEKSSVNKLDILASSELWAFNEKYQMLIHWVALPGTTLGLNRTELTYVDEEHSSAKRVKANQIDQLLVEIRKGNKNRCKAIYTGIKNKEVNTSFRISKNIILLNHFKG